MIDQSTVNECLTALDRAVETMKTMNKKLHDPDYDVLDHFTKVHDRLEECKGVIDDVEDACGRPTRESCDARGRWYNTFMQYLLRLRSASPHLYHCETLGRDKLKEDLEELWKRKGFKDDDGFYWPMPKIFGPYNMRNIEAKTPK